MFSGRVFSLETNLTAKQKKEVKSVIEENGGKVNDFVTTKTHYLLSEGSSGYKRYAAQRLKIPVVLLDFIFDSVKEGEILEAKKYIIQEKEHEKEQERKSILDRESSSDPDGGLLDSSGKVLNTKCQVVEQKIDAEKLFASAPQFPYKSKEDLEISFPFSFFEIAKVDIMHQIHTSSTNFVVIELHVADQNSRHSTDLSAYKYLYRFFMQRGHFKSTDPHPEIAAELCIYFTNIAEAEAVYSYYFNYLIAVQYNKTALLSFGSVLGSDKLKSEGLQNSVNTGGVDSRIQNLVDKLYESASSGIKTLFDSFLGNLPLSTVEKALPILAELRNSPDRASAAKLLEEFENLIPGKKLDLQKQENIELASEQLHNLLDLLRAQECEGLSLSPAEMRYRSMNCTIDALENQSKEFAEISHKFDIPGAGKFFVRNIFKIRRVAEYDQFSEIANVKQLYHGTKSGNMFGILSRGFLLPKFDELTGKYGIQRTHFSGMLGYGVYFANEFHVSHQYTSESPSGSRFILIADVALGNVYECKYHNTDYVAPPSGFDSVQGVKASAGGISQFEDDEFVVYNTSQIRIKYLIEYGPTKDTFTSSQPTPLPTLQPPPHTQNRFSPDISPEPPSKSSKPDLGLIATSGEILPLKSVIVKANILDLASEVVVFQKFRNESDNPIECKYVFELATGCAVCGFEAFIKSRHVIGKVEEKKEAHKKYKEAVESGKRAYMLDESEDESNIFTLSVGNIPPQCDVVIKITYVSEIFVVGKNISFMLPAAVAPTKRDRVLKETTQEVVKTVTAADETLDFQVEIGIDMPYKITTIDAPNHKIKVKKTETKATLELETIGFEGLKEDFVLLIGLEELNRPRMWIEKDAQGNQAALLAFYPAFQYEEISDNEFIFLVDRSNSMKNISNDLLKIIKACLLRLPEGCKFNIISFGTYFERFKVESILKSKETISEAVGYLNSLECNFGSTLIYFPLKSLFLLAHPDKPPRNIFVFSDGQISDEQAVLELVRRNSHHTRVFTVGLGKETCRHVIHSIAKVGGGMAEFMQSATSKQLVEVSERQIKRGLQPCLQDINVEWKIYSSAKDPVKQAPQVLESLFNGERALVYAILSVPCTTAVLRARLQGQEVSAIVNTHELLFTTGNIVHTLAAKAMIKDFTDGIYNVENREVDEIVKREMKAKIIDVSLKYNLVSQFTSFIAVEDEKDFSENEKTRDTPEISEIAGKHEVDKLPYIAYEKLKGEIAEPDSKSDVKNLQKYGASNLFGEGEEESAETYDDHMEMDEIQRRDDEIDLDVITKFDSNEMPDFRVSEACEGEEEEGDEIKITKQPEGSLARNKKASVEILEMIGDVPDTNKLSYRDEFGKEMSAKEAFRQQSYKFHGKSGENKRKKMAEKEKADAKAPKYLSQLLAKAQERNLEFAKIQEGQQARSEPMGYLTPAYRAQIQTDIAQSKESSALPLTMVEKKRVLRAAREARQKECHEKILLGSAPPKVRISNLMRVWSASNAPEVPEQKLDVDARISSLFSKNDSTQSQDGIYGTFMPQETAHHSLPPKWQFTTGSANSVERKWAAEKPKTDIANRDAPPKTDSESRAWHDPLPHPQSQLRILRDYEPKPDSLMWDDIPEKAFVPKAQPPAMGAEALQKIYGTEGGTPKTAYKPLLAWQYEPKQMWEKVSMPKEDQPHAKGAEAPQKIYGTEGGTTKTAFKPLPAPEGVPKMRRGGRRVRKMKEKYAASESCEESAEVYVEKNLTAPHVPRVTKVKSKSPAPVQISAEQILREALERQEPEPPKAQMQPASESQTSQSWKIPPAVSNWKNSKGYTISIEKRLAADGRGLVDAQVNDKFARLSNSLYVAERASSEELMRRSEIGKHVTMGETNKEEQLRKLAEGARSQISEDLEASQARENIREERARERLRELRLESTLKTPKNIDVSEKISLGQVRNEEALYDQRLFNQSENLAPYGGVNRYSLAPEPTKSAQEEEDPFGLDEFLSMSKKQPPTDSRKVIDFRDREKDRERDRDRDRDRERERGVRERGDRERGDRERGDREREREKERDNRGRDRERERDRHSERPRKRESRSRSPSPWRYEHRSPGKEIEKEKEKEKTNVAGFGEAMLRGMGWSGGALGRDQRGEGKAKGGQGEDIEVNLQALAYKRDDIFGERKSKIRMGLGGGEKKEMRSGFSGKGYTFDEKEMESGFAGKGYAFDEKEKKEERRGKGYGAKGYRFDEAEVGRAGAFEQMDILEERSEEPHERKRKFDTGVIEKLLRLQDPSGFWELSYDLVILLDLENTTAEEIEQTVLVDTGCRSLGHVVFDDAKKMVATSLVIAFLRNCEWGRKVGVALESAEHWLRLKEETHPMLPYRLDLGANWSIFADNFLVKFLPQVKRSRG